MMQCVGIIAVTLVVTPAAQSRADRIEAATRVSRSLFEQWFGSVPSAPPIAVIRESWPTAPAAMEAASAIALNQARGYWSHQPPTPLMEGVARYLEARAVGRLFELQFARVGAGVDTLRLFGGTYTMAFPNLRFDGPAAGMDRSALSRPAGRAALAVASLERMVGAPRLIGGLRSVFERAPASDQDVVNALNDVFGQDLGWLFESVLAPSTSMNYRISDVRVEACAPAPCQRVLVAVAHDGAASFRLLEVRVDFADGQSASATWDGHDQSRTLIFEGPAAPARVRVDPELKNLLDDNLLDQSRELGSTTNAPIAKWIARWAVWLQDAMLSYSAVI